MCKKAAKSGKRQREASPSIKRHLQTIDIATKGRKYSRAMNVKWNERNNKRKKE
jgi:hypothetical protein